MTTEECDAWLFLKRMYDPFLLLSSWAKIISQLLETFRWWQERADDLLINRISNSFDNLLRNALKHPSRVSAAVWRAKKHYTNRKVKRCCRDDFGFGSNHVIYLKWARSSLSVNGTLPSLLEEATSSPSTTANGYCFRKTEQMLHIQSTPWRENEGPRYWISFRFDFGLRKSSFEKRWSKRLLSFRLSSNSLRIYWIPFIATEN